MERNKVEKYDAIIEYLNDANAEADLIEMIENDKAASIRRNEKAKERAAEKRKIGDELRDAVQALLSSTPQGLAELTAKIGDPEVTEAKVRNRVSNLVKLGIADKKKMNMKYTDDEGNEKSKPVTVYFLAE